MTVWALWHFDYAPQSLLSLHMTLEGAQAAALLHHRQRRATGDYSGGMQDWVIDEDGIHIARIRDFDTGELYVIAEKEVQP